MEENNRKYIVKDKIFDFYYHPSKGYVSYASEAILQEHEIPENVKKDGRLEIISLESPEGLKILAEEELPPTKV